MAKILYTRNPLVYVDCFAGKGKFDDGNPGSPLIALDFFNRDLLLQGWMGTPGLVLHSLISVQKEGLLIV